MQNMQKKLIFGAVYVKLLLTNRTVYFIMVKRIEFGRYYVYRYRSRYYRM